MRTILVVILLAAATTARAMVVAQDPVQPRPAFDVTSVKKWSARPGPTSVTVTAGASVAPGGAFERVMTVAGLILYAYDLQDHQLLGGPDWIRTDRFEIAARAGREVTTAELRLMLQSLLEDRFGLAAHMESRERPLYRLVLSRADGRLGPGLEKVDGCERMLRRPPNLTASATTSVGCGSIGAMARGASRWVGAPVIDSTGLTGTFEHVLYYSAEGGSISVAGRLVQVPGSAADPDLPAYPTALEEQLGLKLEASRGTVDVLVIDAVQQPTEN